ncbi:MAG: MFS transporter [Chloroflexi bacterium]|nr:MFS transporter [Chloroflexota bacterium]
MTNKDPEDISVAKLIGIGLLTRLVLDTGVQIFFPYISLIAQGLNTTEAAVGRLVSLRSIMGLTSPLFGAFADRQGYRWTMRVGLVFAAVGFLLIGLSQTIWVAMLGMVLNGVGIFAFGPSLQAYLSNLLPYSKRARGLGILEYAWALAGIVGLFVVGYLISATSWRVPFYLFAGLLGIAAVWYGRLPAAKRPQVHEPWRFSWRQIPRFFALGGNQRSTYAVIVCGTMLMFAAVNLFITYGTWLGREYGLEAVALGTVALVMGVSDLVGSVSVSVIGDWLGKKRSVWLGAGASAVFFALLPLFNQGVVAAVAGMVLARGAFEFAVVSNMTLLSEQAPTQRAKTLTLGAAGGLIGGTAAGFTGPVAYATYGATGIALLGAVGMALVCLINWLLVVEAE